MPKIRLVIWQMRQFTKLKPVDKCSRYLRTVLFCHRSEHFNSEKVNSLLHDLVYEFETLEAITIAYAPNYPGDSRTIYHSQNKL